MLQLFSLANMITSSDEIQKYFKIISVKIDPQYVRKAQAQAS